ncbi:ISKra4 family transposase [cf. Phormidesmis sp. LEGE 11477]|uniref:ISKra4 family transposase n=1 Tax=cf. Phormidesmis sp. LEGE 11477 TaxID=1828680 RepID=UPI001880F8CA|nr:ISKra4 family transposase [cf. Phormidesmis sp. LEGE 11477]MBE9061653.1 ISKra4 family transposase [cf. Phormidesmis sp. LEGE 11477]
MLASLSNKCPESEDWSSLLERLQQSQTLAAIVLAAWQIGLYVARTLVEQQLNDRARQPSVWGECPVCGQRLHSKGFAARQMLTLVGCVQWRRRIGRCPNGCSGSQSVPFDQVLGIASYQQSSVELMRLGCLLTLFVPFELAAWLLEQLSGLRVSDDSLWRWVQQYGERAMRQEETAVENWQQGHSPQVEPLPEALAAMPLLLAADGVTVPLRPQLGSPAGKTRWREVKVALLARLSHRINRNGKRVTRLQRRRLVAALGDMKTFQPRLQLEAIRQGIETASQVVWLSDGARGFWRLFEACFAPLAVGILDFYHAAAHLWQAADTYRDGNPARTPQMWFERLRHQLRHGYVHRILAELRWLSRSPNTAAPTKTILKRVHDYFDKHREHVQYRQFKKQGLPIGSGMVESACKWLIQQRFKGVGMRWSEPGLNHLLQLRVAWVNQRFDPLFAQHSLVLPTLSPNR